MAEPKTRQGQAAFRYLREHPAAGPSEVAKAVGCKRETARTHIRAFMAESTVAGVNPGAADAAKSAVAKSATPSPVVPGRNGHHFEEDFPVQDPKKPAPAPQPKPAPEPDDDDDWDEVVF